MIQKRSLGRVFLLSACMAYLLSWPAQGSAQITTWTGTSGGPIPWDFADAGNWTNGTPNASTLAIFSKTGSYDVRFYSDGQSNHAYFHTGTANLVLQAGNYSISGDLSVLEDGGLNLTGGGGHTVSVTGSSFFGYSGSGSGSIGSWNALSNTGNGWIGFENGSSGNVIVNGTWNNGSDLTVGNLGSGELTINTGGLVTNSIGYVGREAGSTGEVFVQGGGQWKSKNLYLGGTSSENGGHGILEINSDGSVIVGNDTGVISGTHMMISDSGSNGNLFVRNGSTILNSGQASLGQSFGHFGAATVTGTDSQWDNGGSLFVGRNGFGALIIADGGVVSNNLGVVGLASGASGSVQVVGEGSTWRSYGGLVLGGSGTQDGGFGSLTLSSGGRVQVGNDSSSTGQMVVGDTGSAGYLIVRNGSVVNAEGYVSVGGEVGHSGEITVTGVDSQLNQSGIGNLLVGGNGTGTLLVNDSGTVNSGYTSLGGSLGGVGNVSVSGSGSQWNNSSGLEVGSNGTGSLNIQSGGVVNVSAGSILGLNSDGIGTVVVTGPGSQWTSEGGVTLGLSGVGTLDVNSGGQVQVGNEAINSSTIGLQISSTSSSANFAVRNGSAATIEGETVIGNSIGATGNAIVTGSSSQLNISNTLNVGVVGSGSLNVNSGGIVNVDGHSAMGSFGGNGMVNVSGLGSKWTSLGGLTLGGGNSVTGYGNGSLNIDSSGLVQIGDDSAYPGGGLVVSDSGADGDLLIRYGSTVDNRFNTYLGFSAGNTGNVIVAQNSKLNQIGSDLFVGLQGNGTLQINSSGVVESRSVFVGNGDDSSGSVTVTGSGSQMNAGAILVGSNGAGTVSVSNGGIVNNAVTRVGMFDGAVGVLNVTGAGSQWNSSDFLSIGSDTSDAMVTISDGGQVNVGSTTTLHEGDLLSIESGGTLQTATLDIQEGIFSLTDGGILRADSVVGDLFNESGILAPGNSPGITTLTGDYLQGHDAALEIELGGLLSGEFDQLIVSGDMTLDGMLNVSLYDGFTLENNQEFLFVQVGGSQMGQFIGLNESGLVGSFGGNNLYISYVAGDGNDLALFTSVPEPGSMFALMLGAFAILKRRRRVAS